MDNTYSVYIHTTPSGKKYVGMTSNHVSKRWRGGSGYKYNEHFYRAIKKYGWDYIVHDVILDGLTKEEACFLEIKLIAKYDTTDSKCGYNNSSGGECGSVGCTRSDAHKLAVSNAHKGKELSDAHKLAISNCHKGVPLDEEHKRKIGDAQLGEKNHRYGKHFTEAQRIQRSDALSGENNPFYGKKHTDETRKRISESNKGKKWTDEMKASYPHTVCTSERKKILSKRMSGKGNPMYGKKGKDAPCYGRTGDKHPMFGTHRTEEFKRNRSKPVYQLNMDGVVIAEYYGMEEASKKTGASVGGIGKVCNGRLKTAGGFKWEYADK